MSHTNKHGKQTEKQNPVPDHRFRRFFAQVQHLLNVKSIINSSFEL